MAYKSLKITTEAHDKIKLHCDKNFLKISDWVSHILIQHIDKMENTNVPNNDKK